MSGHTTLSQPGGGDFLVMSHDSPSLKRGGGVYQWSSLGKVTMDASLTGSVLCYTRINYLTVLEVFFVLKHFLSILRGC